MAISFINYGYAAAVSATSITPTEPTSTAENDLVLAFMQADGTTADWVDPADFTQIDQVVTTTGQPIMIAYIGYKVRGSTAGSGYQFSHSNTAGKIAGSLVTLRGIDTSTPIDVTYVRASHFVEGAINDPNLTPAAITTNTDGAWVVLFYGTTQTVDTSTGQPTGYTVIEDELVAADPGRGQYVCRKEIATATTETPGAYTHSDSGAGADPDPFAFTIAIRPAAASVNTSILVPTGPWR